MFKGVAGRVHSMSRIDYGSLEPGASYRMVDGVPVKQPAKKNARSTRGYVLEGVATKYDAILYESGGRYINIQPGAFDISLKYEAPVECWLDHDKNLRLADC